MISVNNNNIIYICIYEYNIVLRYFVYLTVVYFAQQIDIYFN